MKLNDFSTKEIEALKELCNDAITSCNRYKEIARNYRIEAEKNREIEQFELLKVKLTYLLGGYQD